MYHEVEAEFPHGKEVYVHAHSHARACVVRAILRDAVQLLLHHAVLRRASWRHRNGPDGKGPSSWSRIARHASHVTLQLQVGVPAAIATQLLLDGRVAARGVVRPMDPAVYEPMLQLLEQEGIVVHEKRIA